MPAQPQPHKRILVLADIEGSSDCHDYPATTFLGKGWPRACLGMSRDVDTVVKALLAAGVNQVYVKDFHRTGYNIFRSEIDARARLISGYFKGPVPGIGRLYQTTGLILLGMHAPSGSQGFLAHTLTSKIERLRINGRQISEAELFSAVLVPFGLVPLFFSGCPAACAHVENRMNPIQTFPITPSDKKNETARVLWRRQLAESVSQSLSHSRTMPFQLSGPFDIDIRFRHIGLAAKRSKQWGLRRSENTIFFSARTIEELYQQIIAVVYLSPAMAKGLPWLLPVYNLGARFGLTLARWSLLLSKTSSSSF